ncbi:Predicted metal-binding protein related to the C-terminal domain of SecA [Actinobacillus equuli]|nr:Predicted metal-binding protein related to the C-terminal domain of SecA [Actinobacillus equuli]
MSDKLAAPLTSEEFEQLDELLFSYANKGDEDAILLNVSELDGFLTAILSSVNVPAMTDWLPICLIMMYLI